MNLITETKNKLEYQKNELNDLLECFKKPVTKDCQHHLQEEIDKTKKRISYYNNILETLSKNTEWDLGRNEDKYFLFLQKEILTISIDISKIEADRIEKNFGVKAVEYPF